LLASLNEYSQQHTALSPRCAAFVIGQSAGFLNDWQAARNREKNGRTQGGVECSLKRFFLEKNVVVIIKVSSLIVYATNVYKKAHGHVSGHRLTLYILRGLCGAAMDDILHM